MSAVHKEKAGKKVRLQKYAEEIAPGQGEHGSLLHI